jgi:glycerol-3-phosphate cytidylyltransferase
MIVPLAEKSAHLMEKVVLTYGTFDLFHIGHLSLLQRLRRLGDTLIVGVTTDEFNARRGKVSCIPFSERIQIVESIRYVDQAIAMECADQKADDIQRYKVNILGMGSDWVGQLDALRSLCEVVYLPRTEGISSSRIRDALCAGDDHFPR